MDDAWEAWYDWEAAYVEDALENVVLDQVIYLEIAEFWEDFWIHMEARLDERDFFSEAYRYEYRETEITTGNTRDVREPDSLELEWAFRFSVVVCGDVHYCGDCWGALGMTEQSRLSAYDGAEVHQSPVYALVGCGADKTDGDHEAADLYVSPYFTAKQRFAELVADSWWIVSAEYRLVASDDQIRDYDMDVRELDVGLWLDDIPDTLDRYWDAPRRVWVLAGEALSAADKRGPDPGARGKLGCHRRRCLLPVPSNAENRRPAPVVTAMY